MAVILMRAFAPFAVFGVAEFAVAEEWSARQPNQSLHQFFETIAERPSTAAPEETKSPSVVQQVRRAVGRVAARGILYVWPEGKSTAAPDVAMPAKVQPAAAGPEQARTPPPLTQTSSAPPAPIPHGTEPPPPPSHINSTWGAMGGGDWNDAGKWSNDPDYNAFPNNGQGGVATYNARIDTGDTVTLNQNITIEQFTLESSSLSSSGSSLTLGGIFTWNGGNISGVTLNANGGLAVTSQVFFDSGTLNLASGQNGTFDNFAEFNLNNGAIFNNDGTLTVQTSSGSSMNGSGTFNNTGTFTLATTDGSVFPIFGVVFSNSGTVNVTSGTLDLEGGDGGNTTGVFNVDGGAVFRLGNDFTFAAGSSIAGAGQAWFSGGTIAVNGSFNVTGSSVFDTNVTFGAMTITSVGAVTINGGTVDFGSNSFTAASLDQLGGTLTGTGTIDSTGQVTWNFGGSVAVTGTGILNANGGIWLDGTSLSLDQRTVTNATGQTATMSNLSEIRFANGATFTNNGSFNEQGSSGSGFFDNGGGGTFNNAGAFTHSSGDVFTISAGVAFANSGTVDVTSGTLALQGGDGSGTSGAFSVSSGATLSFESDFSLGGTSGISGAGTVKATFITFNSSGSYGVTGASTFTSSTVNLGSWVTSVGALTIDNSSVDFAGSTFSASTVDLISGQLSGSGTATASGLFTWQDGRLFGVGGQVIANGGISASFNNVTLDGYTLTNGATSTATFANTVSLFLESGAIFKNNGNLLLQTSGGTAGFSTTSSGSFENAGTLTHDTGGDTFAIQVPFTSSGTMNVQTGTMEFSGGGTNTGALAVASGATALFSNGTYNFDAGSNVSGAGTVSIGNATWSFNAGSYNVGSTTISVGTANFNAAATTASLSLTGSALDGSGTISVTDNLTWTGGTMDGGGTTTVAGSASTINDNTGGGLALGRTLTNTGAMTYSGEDNEAIFLGALAFGPAMLGNSGTFNVTAGGDFTDSGGNATSRALNNSGTWNVSGAGTTSVVGTNITFNNTGTANVLSGALHLEEKVTSTGAFNVAAGATLAFGQHDHDFNSGALLSGAGNVQVNGSGSLQINSDAVLQGGNGTAETTLTVTGALTMNDNSIIQLALGPTLTHSTLDRAGGTWTFDTDQAFAILDLGAQAGTYQNIITGLADDPNPNNWMVTGGIWMGTFTFDGANIDLELTAVPEMSTWLSGACALIAVAWMQRRRIRGRR